MVRVYAPQELWLVAGMSDGCHAPSKISGDDPWGSEEPPLPTHLERDRGRTGCEHAIDDKGLTSVAVVGVHRGYRLHLHVERVFLAPVVDETPAILCGQSIRSREHGDPFSKTYVYYITYLQNNNNQTKRRILLKTQAICYYRANGRARNSASST